MTTPRLTHTTCAPPLPSSPRADAGDFELLRSLGTVSYTTERGLAERTLTWRGGDNGTVPDSFSVVDQDGRGVSGRASHWSTFQLNQMLNPSRFVTETQPNSSRETCLSRAETYRTHLAKRA